jgi:copper resistance protein C
VLLLHRAVRRLLRRTCPSAPARRPAPFRVLQLPASRTAGVLVIGTLTLAGAFASAVTGAEPASAHAVLVKATPADGAVLRTAPTSVVLQFDDPISSSFATLTVTGPDGSTVSPGKASVSGTTVSAALDDGLEPGRYRTVFRVVSEDGHPVNGQLTFTVKLPGGAPPPPTTPGAPATGTTSGGATPGSPSTTPADGAPSPSGDPGASSTAAGSTAGGSSWLADNLLPLTGALLLVVIGVGALLWDRLRH